MAVTSASGPISSRSAFEFVRNDIFDARSFIDDTNRRFAEPLAAALGGPIVRDKTFFFTAYEGYRKPWDKPCGLCSHGRLSRPSGRSISRAHSFPDAYPEGALPVAGNPDVSEFIGAGRQLGNETPDMRVDQRFSDKTTASSALF